MDDVNRPIAEGPRTVAPACLCAALRRASRAVTRIYDAELRASGLRTTQHTLLVILGSSGEVRQGDLGDLASIDETTLTRNLRPLRKAGWVDIRPGADRREKRIAITEAGRAKVEEARPAWSRAQARMREALPTETWRGLFEALPIVAEAASGPTSVGEMS